MQAGMHTLCPSYNPLLKVNSRYAGCSIVSLPIMRNFSTKSICSLHGLRMGASVILIQPVAFVPSSGINMLGTTSLFRILGS
jgi:hypothetical protein